MATTVESEDRQPFDLFSTVIVSPGGAHVLRGFCYSLGQKMPGPFDVVASRADTNLAVSNQLVDRPQRLRAFAIRIPTVVSARLTPDGIPYLVDEADVRAFCERAVLRLFIGGDVPWIELLPRATRVWIVSGEAGRDGRFGSFSERAWPSSDETLQPVLVRGQDAPFAFERGIVLPEPLIVNRIEKFWTELSWIDGPPAIKGGPLAIEFWMIGEVATELDRSEAFRRVAALVDAGRGEP